MIDGQRVTLATGCMNRLVNLMIVLPSWLALAEVDEIIIVDWNSTFEVRRILRTSGFRDPRLRFYRVEDQSHWSISKCRNLAWKVGTGDRILITDADVSFEPEFLVRYSLGADEFWTGSWQVARDENEQHLNGTIYTHRDTLARVNGYDERMVGYGYDDDDLYTRLHRLGFGRRFCDPDMLHHLPHGDAERVVCDPLPQYPGYSSLNDSARDRMRRSASHNRRLAVKRPWTAVDGMTEWVVAKQEEDLWLCRASTGDGPAVPGKESADAG